MQLAQTVEGITHLVEVHVSALGSLPSTIVYSATVDSGSHSGGQMATWVVEAPPQQLEQHHHQQQQHESKFSDIVSASIEAIGFPESVTPGTTILSQAERILITSDTSGSAVSAPSAANFDFDESSNTSLTLNERCAPGVGGGGGYLRPKKESIESRINRLLRGPNSVAPVAHEQPDEWSLHKSAAPAKNSKTTSTTSRSVPTTPAAAARRSTARIMMSTTATATGGRPVSIPTIYTSTTVAPASAPAAKLVPGSDYLMPRGVSKRKAQNCKVTKTTTKSANPNCIDADPAPPEETQVKLVMTNQVVDEDDPDKDDDEYNR